MRPLLIALALPVLASGEIVFNRDVRPILSDKCYSCHGPDQSKRMAKLRLDQEEGARTVILSGKLLQRVSATDATRMPPQYAGKDALNSTQIDTLRQWIAEGATWQPHWSFIPPQRPPGDIDTIVAARLTKESLHRSPEADRPTLIRRVSLDLTGIPPTPVEVDAFVNDPSSSAYEKVVDRLLSSPRYAEKMTARWLDAARYADTNGYQSDGERSMWRWRDWVIDAYRRNMPFDQFTIEQLAGDLLPNSTLSQRIATGFQRNHRTNAEGGIVPEEFRVEYVADRAETTSIVWMGLTMGCARCHDHKYDPIKQRDFYRLFAFYNNVPEKGLVYNFGNDEPMIKAPTDEQAARLASLDADVARAEATWKSMQPKLIRERTAWERKTARLIPIAWSPTADLILDRPQTNSFDGQRTVDLDTKLANFNYLDPFTLSAWIKPSTPDGAILTRVEDYFEGEGYGLYILGGKLRLHNIKRWTDIGMRLETQGKIPLDTWTHVTATYDGSRYAAGVKLFLNGEEQKVDVLFDDLNFPLGAKEPFRIGGGGGPKLRFRGDIRGVKVYKRALNVEEVATLPVANTVDDIVKLRPAQRSFGQQQLVEHAFQESYASPEIQAAKAALEQARAARRKFYDTIPTVMVMKESDTPRDAFVLKRGAYDAHGEKVAPGIPDFLPPFGSNDPTNRLGLARWLVSRKNPLTARVIVNRFWQSYFGSGIVKTVEDFGAQGEPPINQDLLDYLAVQFMESGWDVRAMQKTIVMSATYRQSSKVTPELLQRDPENRLLARGPRFRLPAEVIRDQALAASGLLVEKTGGPSVKPYQPPGLWQELAGGSGYKQDQGEGQYRRSMYTYWKRTVAPPSLANFDAPTRETCTVRENRTNTPLQALDLMNDPVYVEAAQKLADRMVNEGGATAEGRIALGYRLVLGRAPKPRELELLQAALNRFGSYTPIASMLLNLDETVTKE